MRFYNVYLYGMKVGSVWKTKDGEWAEELGVPTGAYCPEEGYDTRKKAEDSCREKAAFAWQEHLSDRMAWDKLLLNALKKAQRNAP